MCYFLPSVLLYDLAAMAGVQWAGILWTVFVHGLCDATWVVVCNEVTYIGSGQYPTFFFFFLSFCAAFRIDYSRLL